MTPSSLENAEAWRTRCVPLPLLGNAHQQRSMVDNWICNTSNHVSLTTAVVICFYTSFIEGYPFAVVLNSSTPFTVLGFLPVSFNKSLHFANPSCLLCGCSGTLMPPFFSPNVCHPKNLPMLHRHEARCLGFSKSLSEFLGVQC